MSVKGSKMTFQKESHKAKEQKRKLDMKIQISKGPGEGMTGE
jgi:hypothetical protein